MFRIFTTEEFDSNFNNLNESEQLRVKKILRQFKEKGGDVGKPLGLSFFKQKRFDGKRIYFLIYNSIKTALAIAISDKKAQQATINQILLNIKKYQQYVFNLLKEEQNT